MEGLLPIHGLGATLPSDRPRLGEQSIDLGICVMDEVRSCRNARAGEETRLIWRSIVKPEPPVTTASKSFDCWYLARNALVFGQERAGVQNLGIDLNAELPPGVLDNGDDGDALRVGAVGRQREREACSVLLQDSI